MDVIFSFNTEDQTIFIDTGWELSFQFKPEDRLGWNIYVLSHCCFAKVQPEHPKPECWKCKACQRPGWPTAGQIVCGTNELEQILPQWLTAFEKNFELEHVRVLRRKILALETELATLKTLAQAANLPLSWRNVQARQSCFKLSGSLHS